MNENIYTRDPGGSRRRIEPEETTKKMTHADKLKNDTSRAKAMRGKFRTGKADNRETKLEIKKRKKLQKQGRKKIYKDAALTAKMRNQVDKANEDNNAGVDAISAGLLVADNVTTHSRYSSKVKSGKKDEKKGYGTKLHGRAQKEEVKVSSKEVQKNLMKKEIQRNAYKQSAKESANAVGSVGKKLIDKAEDMVGRLAELVREFLAEHPMALVIAGVVLIVVLVLSGALSSCSMMASGSGNMVIVTSFTAQDEDILTVNAMYTDKEAELQEKIENIETDYPGYDEYNYSLNEISHNPFELAALLTVLYEDYTPAEVQAKLSEICEMQYKLDLVERVETRTRTETRYDDVTGEPYEVEVEYEYKILNVTLTNYSVDHVARHIGLNAEQLERYEILLETYGNKAYLFEGDPYAVAVQTLEYEDYAIPGEYLTNEQFANMMREAEKYLGMSYVWGGSSPGTGFDCSGFVSYVINHCGNGWNYGRLTANGWKNATARVSAGDVAPGDLVFFKGTYNTSGASHVGIVVDPVNKIMIHCGNPIQYASYDTNYWRQHMYCYGRVQ